MHKWIARLAYPFLIVGGVLFYQVYKYRAAGPQIPEWQAIVIVIGASLAVAMGITGIRIRHRMMRED